jgi:hypothetical protein
MINNFAWARILDDTETIAAMSDSEFAEFWTATGRALRIASRASKPVPRTLGERVAEMSEKVQRGDLG